MSGRKTVTVKMSVAPDRSSAWWLSVDRAMSTTFMPCWNVMDIRKSWKKFGTNGKYTCRNDRNIYWIGYTPNRMLITPCCNVGLYYAHARTVELCRKAILLRQIWAATSNFLHNWHWKFKKENFKLKILDTAEIKIA